MNSNNKLFGAVALLGALTCLSRFPADAFPSPESISVRDKGAKGDGITDDRVAIQAAIDAAAEAGGGVVFFPAGTYLCTRSSSRDGACISLKSRVHLRGEGKSSIIKMASGQDKFTRLIAAKGQTDLLIRNLAIDGNMAGNPLTQGPHSKEQQHGVFLDHCTNAVIEDVDVHSTRGDGIYLFGQCLRPKVIHCTFHDTDRVNLHAQSFQEAVVRECRFTGKDTGQGHIKSELDQEGPISKGLTITNCTFNGGSINFGILMSGFSATTPMEDVTVRNCTFRGLAMGIGMGTYSRGWKITGNTIEDCAEGIVSTNYAPRYGYDGQRDITIDGNILKDVHPNGRDQWAISVANCTGGNIAANRLEGGGAHGIRVVHSRDVEVRGNTLEVAGAAAQAVQLYRSQRIKVRENQLAATEAGGIGIYVADDDTYPAEDLEVGGNSLSGAFRTRTKSDLSRSAKRVNVRGD